MFRCVAVRADGTLAQHGYSEFTVIPVPDGAFSTAAAGGTFAVAIRQSDGALVPWGYNNYNELNVPAGSYIAASCGFWFGAAIATDGTLHAWGRDWYPGPKLYGSLLNPPPGKYKAVSCGPYNAAAIREDGALVGWGWEYGIVGKFNPTGKYKDIAVGYTHAFAIREDGTMEVFGNSPHNAPTAGLFRSVSCCDKLGVVIHDDGSMTAWDVYDSVHFPGVFLDAVASAVGPTALSASPLCPGDFDADMSQSVNDFIAFQTYFALGDEMCDCEADGQLLIDDFLCFQTLYAIGC